MNPTVDFVKLYDSLSEVYQNNTLDKIANKNDIDKVELKKILLEMNIKGLISVKVWYRTVCYEKVAKYRFLVERFSMTGEGEELAEGKLEETIKTNKLVLDVYRALPSDRDYSVSLLQLKRSFPLVPIHKAVKTLEKLDAARVCVINQIRYYYKTPDFNEDNLVSPEAIKRYIILSHLPYDKNGIELNALAKELKISYKTCSTRVSNLISKGDVKQTMVTSNLFYNRTMKDI